MRIMKPLWIISGLLGRTEGECMSEWIENPNPTPQKEKAMNNELCECGHESKYHLFTPLGSVCDMCRIEGDANDCTGYRPKAEPPERKIYGCNFHSDCVMANERAKEQGRERPVHCSVEDCEDCYGK